MNPILITNIPLLKAAFLLLMVIGFTHTSRTTNCDTKVVQAISISSMCSQAFIRVNGSTVKADAKVNYTMYTITHPKSTAFFLYDPQQSKFICFKNKRKKKLFVAKRIIKPSDLCLLEEIPVPDPPSSPYTMYRLYNSTHSHTQDFLHPCKNEHCLGFNINGLQKFRKNTKCIQSNKHVNIFFKKKQTSAPCAEYYNDFCRQMRKLSLKHHSHMLQEIKEVCKWPKRL